MDVIDQSPFVMNGALIESRTTATQVTGQGSLRTRFPGALTLPYGPCGVSNYDLIE